MPDFLRELLTWLGWVRERVSVSFLDTGDAYVCRLTLPKEVTDETLISLVALRIQMRNRLARAFMASLRDMNREAFAAVVLLLRDRDDVVVSASEAMEEQE